MKLSLLEGATFLGCLLLGVFLTRVLAVEIFVCYLLPTARQILKK